MDLFQAERRARGGHTVGRVIWDALHDAILRAGLDVRADVARGRVAPVAAVRVGVHLVHGMGEGVKDDVVRLRAASLEVGAAVGSELGMDFWSIAGLLSRGKTQKERKECELASHADGMSLTPLQDVLNEFGLF